LTATRFFTTPPRPLLHRREPFPRPLFRTAFLFRLVDPLVATFFLRRGGFFFSARSGPPLTMSARQARPLATAELPPELFKLALKLTFFPCASWLIVWLPFSGHQSAGEVLTMPRHIGISEYLRPFCLSSPPPRPPHTANDLR